MTVAATWIHGRRSPDVMSAATAARGGRVTTVRPLCDRLAHDTTDTDGETSDVCTSGPRAFVASRYRVVMVVVLSVVADGRQGPSVPRLGSTAISQKRSLWTYSSNFFDLLRDLRYRARARTTHSRCDRESDSETT